MRLLTPWSLSQGGACSRKLLLQAAWCGPPPFRASTLGLSLEGHVHLSLQEMCFRARSCPGVLHAESDAAESVSP